MPRTIEGRQGVRRPWGPARWVGVCLLLIAAACTSTGDGGGSASATTTRVSDLRATQPGSWQADGRGWSVSLRWTPLSGDTTRYAVRRDGDLLSDQVRGTTFVDRTALPGSGYVYSVAGVDASGRTTRPATLAVRTDEPPKAQGRMAGVFLTRLHLVTSHGLAVDPSGGAFTFVFHPVCRRGPCAVRWRVGERHTSGRLGWLHAAYAGVVRGPFQIRSCRGDTIDERLQVRLHVTDAAVVGSEWRATRFRGTLVESSMIAGCVPAGITWKLRGAIQT